LIGGATTNSSNFQAALTARQHGVVPSVGTYAGPSSAALAANALPVPLPVVPPPAARGLSPTLPRLPQRATPSGPQRTEKKRTRNMYDIPYLIQICLVLLVLIQSDVIIGVQHVFVSYASVVLIGTPLRFISVPLLYFYLLMWSLSLIDVHQLQSRTVMVIYVQHMAKISKGNLHLLHVL
jgi:hypothetical protein